MLKKIFSETMFLSVCVLFMFRSTAFCMQYELNSSLHSEIVGLKSIVGKMEVIIDRQEKTISEQAKLMNVANDKIRLLSDQVSSLQKGPFTRGKRQTETVAFTAYIDHSEAVHKGNVLKFNRVLYNAGNAYNANTGIFTAPTTGTYIFSFHVEDWRTNEMSVYLKVDGTNMVDAIIDDGGSAQSGNTAILGLTVGNAVWVETIEGYVFGDGGFRGTTFCGALLY